MSEEFEEFDNFDDIVSGLSGDEGEDEVEDVEFETVLDVVEHFWKDLYPGHIFVKGIVIVESATPDGRSLRYQTSSPSSEWEVLGMLESVKQGIIAQGVADVLTSPMIEDDEDDD